MSKKSPLEIAARRLNSGEITLSDCEKAGGLAWASKVNEKAGQLKLIGEQENDSLRPADLVEIYLCNHKVLHDSSGNFYVYRGTHWELEPRENLKAAVLQLEAFRLRTSWNADEAIRILAGHEKVHRAAIQWNNLKDSEAAFKNGIVDLLTGILRPHRPEDFIDQVLPFDWTPGATCPQWDALLDFQFGPDAEHKEKIAALQEFFGYVLLNHARFKKALVLKGPSNTGKSVVTNILRHLVGHDHVCHIKVDDMGDARKLAPIYRKRLNLLGELTTGATIDDGGFKELISTEEAIQLDPKNEKPILYVPVCKHVFATNNLPRVDDKTEAVFNRFLIIQFNRVVQAHERDSSIETKLRAELPGIVVWAANGARRLAEHEGEFTPVIESNEALMEYKLEQNPVEEFIKEQYQQIPGAETFFDQFCADFNDWWDGDKTDKRRTIWSIGYALKGLGYRRERVRQPDSDNKRRVIKGLSRKTKADPQKPQ